VYKIIDLFCGTGAISHGLALADDQLVTIGGIDINTAACETAKANNPLGCYINNSISNVEPVAFSETIGTDSVDVIVGGPPCQGFSSIRPNRGSLLNDERNELYRDYISYMEFFRPKVFLMENVVGLISHSKGRLLEEVLAGFERIGYDVNWKVLNSANYGVPQKRERLFVLGRERTMNSIEPLLFPKPSHWFEGKVIGTKHKSNYIVNKTEGLPAVTFDEATSDLPSIRSGESAKHYKTPPTNKYQSLIGQRSSDVLTLHNAANHSDKMLEVIRHSGSSIASIPNGLITSGFSSCYSRLEGDKPSTTITVKFTSPSSSKCIHPYDDRAITPREAARVQSFEDSYIFCGSKTDIANQLGNAVPPLLGLAFGKVISRYLSGISE
jgi:DNA (cytosine-5)-methyltransferase 1